MPGGLTPATPRGDTASDGHNQDDDITVFAKRTLHAYITLHVETKSQHDLKLALNSSPAGGAFGAQKSSNVRTLFDVKQSAEPAAQPPSASHLRRVRVLRLLFSG